MHTQRISLMQRLDRLHTALADAMPDADGAMRAELEAMETQIMEMRQRAALGRQECQP